MASLGGFAKQKGVKYFLVSFVDLFGTMRAKIVPATAIDEIAGAGAGFAGFATWFDMTPADPDCSCHGGSGNAIQLPWKPEVAWVTARPVHGRRAGPPEPAQIGSKRPSRRAGEAGYELKSGVECEFFLIRPTARDFRRGRHADQALLRPAGADAALRRHRRNLRLHDRARLGAVSKRSRGRQRPVRDELGIRRRAHHGRPPRLLQIHGQVDR